MFEITQLYLAVDNISVCGDILAQKCRIEWTRFIRRVAIDSQLWEWNVQTAFLSEINKKVNDG